LSVCNFDFNGRICHPVSHWITKRTDHNLQRQIQHARKYIEVTIESFFHAKSGKMFESKRSANFGCASKTRLTIKGRITEFAIQSVVKCR